MTVANMLPRPSTSLYVGSLAPDVTEANLFEIFNQVGPVASIRVCRDAFTRRSLGYAYVNFHNVVDAERALDTLNYTPIKNRPCRIMWSHRDPGLRKSGLGNIFIKNLDKGIDNKMLHDTFSTFGNILSCRVMTDENGNSRGFGFVHFENSESAEQAIAKVNGMLLNDKKVYVGLHISRKERSSKYDELKKNFTNVFVKNIEEGVTDEELRNMFAQFGEITSAAVARDEAGKGRGFGFVNFATHEQAHEACDEMNEKEVNGKKLYVGRAQKKAERKEELQRKYEALKMERLNKYQGVNLYIKNLDDTITDEKLRTEFAAFGTITSSKIQVDERGNSRGFGFVCFSSPEEATKAVTDMNGRMMGTKPIYVALAQRKELRRQQLEAQYAQRAQLRLAQQSGVLGPPGIYGQPIFFNPVGVPQARGQQAAYMPASYMVPRPRWPAPQQGSQPQQPELMGGYPVAAGARPPRTQQGAGTRSRPAGQAPPANRIPNGVQPAQPGLPGQPRNKPFRYTGNVRNRVDQPPTVPAAPAVAQVPEPLTLSLLAGASPQDQKQMIGERLFPLIYEKVDPQDAGKITGMLLDMDNAELLHLIESPESLTLKIEEAKKVLEDARSSS